MSDRDLRTGSDPAGGWYRHKEGIRASDYIENVRVVSLGVEEIRNDGGSLKRFCFRSGAKRAADPGKPAPADTNKLLRGVAGAKDEKVHAEEDNGNAEWLKVYLTDRNPATQVIDRALR